MTAAIYLTDIVQVQHGDESVFQPAVPEGTQYVALMMHLSTMKAMIVSPVTNLTGPGITFLVSGTSWTDLRTKSKRDTVSQNLRNTINSWCSAAGLQPLPTGSILWVDAIEYVARQVNPNVRLDTTYLNDDGVD